MSIHRTGPGQCERRTSPPSSLLYNFDVDGDEPKREHLAFLRGNAMAPLRNGGSVAVVGLASRTGSTAHNQALSERRAKRVLECLREIIPKRFPVKQVVAYGEIPAQREGYRNDVEDPRFRSVILLVSTGPTPPEVPPVVNIAPEIGVDALMPGFDAFDMLSKSMDVTQGVAGLFELLPWGTVAEFAGSLGPLVGIVGGVVAMPLLWKGVRDQNLTNGGMEGFWDAMQDMALAFANVDPVNTPVSRWPAIPVPKAHPLAGSNVLVNEREWFKGRQDGAAAAYKMITSMEEKPVHYKGARGGPNLPLTGRSYLYWIFRGTNGHVDEAIHKIVDDRLRAAGKKEWPLRE